MSKGISVPKMEKRKSGSSAMKQLRPAPHLCTCNSLRKTKSDVIFNVLPILQLLAKYLLCLADVSCISKKKKQAIFFPHSVEIFVSNKCRFLKKKFR